MNVFFSFNECGAWLEVRTRQFGLARKMLAGKVNTKSSAHPQKLFTRQDKDILYNNNIPELIFMSNIKCSTSRVALTATCIGCIATN